MDWNISEVLQGQQGKYSGSFCASNTKDVLETLQKLLPGSSAAKSKLVYAKGSALRVNASEYLAALETELRQSVVALCTSFSKRGVQFGPPPGILLPSYNGSQLSAFFDPTYDRNKLPIIDCYVAIHIIMARTAQQAMGSAYEGSAYQSGHFYKDEKGMLKQNNVNTPQAMRIGDWGYIHGYESLQPNGKGGMQWVSTAGHESTTGENIAKMNETLFFGFFTGGGSSLTPDQWKAKLKESGQASNAGPGPHRFGRIDSSFFINIGRIVTDTFNFNSKKK